MKKFREPDLIVNNTLTKTEFMFWFEEGRCIYLHENRCGVELDIKVKNECMLWRFDLNDEWRNFGAAHQEVIQAHKEYLAEKELLGEDQ